MVVLAFIGSSNSLRAGVPEEHIEYEAGGIVLQGFKFPELSPEMLYCPLLFNS